MNHSNLILCVLAVLVCTAGAQVRQDDPQGRHLVPTNWWESAAAIARVHLGRQFPLDPDKAAPMMDDLKTRGISAIEIFAPYHGGRSYGGLDAIDRFNVNPELGTMDDFRKLVRLIHSKGMAVISFDNLGYCSTEAPEFLKACDDVKAGKDTAEARRFLWADSSNAPPPAPSNDKFFKLGERWEFNERAGKYFWTKWLGPNLAGKVVRLPQYNWGSEEFQQYAERAVRFWMDTGLDGMIIDAVNWYLGHTWEQDRKRITDVIRSYGNAYAQPEGGGGFHEDPVAWITEGGWNSVQDYGLGIWWEKDNHVLRNAIENGDPRPVERALRDYHDRVVAAGGVLYLAGEGHARFEQPEKQRLALALEALSGCMFGVNYGRSPGFLQDLEIHRLLELKRVHPALYNLSARRQLPTNADDKYYAFLRACKDGTERLLVVMNFQSTPQTVEVDVSGVAAGTLVELTSGASVARRNPFPVELPAYGYRFYRVQ